MEKKRALITGITGQDGAYLAKLLLDKGYRVYGLQRRCSLSNTTRLTPLLEKYPNQLTLHQGDLTDAPSLLRVIAEACPDEIYNLAAQSDVAVSFESPEYTANVNGLGTLRILETLRNLKMENTCRFYQASTSELFGLVKETPQRETTPFHPRSPYSVAKLFGYWTTINYRESYGMFACNGILFNHESPLRGETFVTRKITRQLGRVMMGLQPMLHLGNLNSMRDWGHARDFVEMLWLILQQESPDDYVVATGEQHSVREFVTFAADELGIKLRWEGVGLEERGIVESVTSPESHALTPGQTIVAVDPRFFRPAEVNTLLGDASKAFQNLKWKPKISFKEMVTEMAKKDLMLAVQEANNSLSHEACLH